MMEFDAIVAVNKAAQNSVLAPCGNCMQMIFEYAPDIKVIVNDETGTLIKVKASSRHFTSSVLPDRKNFLWFATIFLIRSSIYTI